MEMSKVDGELRVASTLKSQDCLLETKIMTIQDLGMEDFFACSE